MSDITHYVTVTITGNYQHGDKADATVTLGGRGDLEHMLSTFRAALVVAGFRAETAALLNCEAPNHD
jgi:hypothetical protein